MSGMPGLTSSFRTWCPFTAVPRTCRSCRPGTSGAVRPWVTPARGGRRPFSELQMPATFRNDAYPAAWPTPTEDGEKAAGDLRDGSDGAAAPMKALAEGDEAPNPASLPVKRKKSPAERKKRKPLSLEHRQKISQANSGRTFTLNHRYNLSQCRMGTTHTEEVRKKISAAMRLSHAKRRQKAEAARAASGVQMLELEATLMRRHDPAHQNLPSLLELLGPQELRDIAAGGGGTEGMRALARERLVMSVTSLRHELSAWMQAQAAERGAAPSMRATASSHPAVYAKFVRFVALKQALRHLEEGRQGSGM
ncbi:hypothetical protein ACKKBF_B18820 [Auxenochlorella protothecoides x Auxenochlorella symbiontica]